MEHANLLVVFRHRTLTLKHAYLNRRLIVGSGAEHLLLVYRDGGVGIDKLCHHTAEGLDTERQRSHVKQKDILHVTCKHAALDSCTDGHNLIRVDALVRLLAEEVLNKLLHLRDTG